MAGFVVMLLASMLAAPPSANYAAQLESLKAAGNLDEAEQVSAAWKKAQPDDAEAFVAAANLYVARAQGGIAITREPPSGPQAIALSNPDTGEVVGSIRPAEMDRGLMEKAVRELREASARFPRRLDLRFGLAHLLRELGDDAALASTLEAALSEARAEPTALRWCQSKQLPLAKERLAGLLSPPAP